MLQLFDIAKELGMSVGTVMATMTMEEIQGWSCYFSILAERQERAMNR